MCEAKSWVGPDWLRSSSKLQPCLELYRFVKALLQLGLYDGKCPFHWNWPENPIMTLIPTDGVLFEVCNRKERCHSWGHVAKTSHVWTLSMLLFQDSTDKSITLFIHTPIIWSSNVGMSFTHNQVHSLVRAYHRATSLRLHKMLQEAIPSS
jgi:hypothetical protein